ncbi:DUF6113 family protein [Streptomyces longispororuber]|uniref:DUF6113 family protein n=1 Tax=Streptomyces longispororuber TaxID=68230 RepID=UPI00210BEB81|nr:DUF6113 family protein [Streptomyces longispororuber]MCQ4211428.1 DUF6113 family protein [Streptomyces longispororuber]
MSGGKNGRAAASAGKGTAPQQVDLPFSFGALTAGRIAALLVLFVLGALVGAAGALAQGGWFPGGLLLALLGAAGLFHGGARLTGGRSGAVAPAAGWLVAVILLTASRPEGDFLFGAGLGSYLFLLGGMAVAVICATLGLTRQPPASAARLGK